MKVIYQPKGKALEYSPLALNLYKGCAHGCTYCYAKKMAKRFGNDTFSVSVSRPNILEKLNEDGFNMRGRMDKREINLCFMCDPYSPPDGGDITREALLILYKYSLNVSILTKAGTRACRDFDLLKKACWKFGSSITCFGQQRTKIEPNAANLFDRISAIQTAHKMGIFTYVSLEPVIDADQAIEIITSLYPFVDFWKIGKINYEPEIEKNIDWKAFVARARVALKNSAYMFKKDTLAAAGE
jgi:DNA repair photolyase